MSSEVLVFRAASMPDAVARVKRELGPDAVILGVANVPGAGKDAKPLVEIRAARSAGQPAGAAPAPPAPRRTPLAAPPAVPEIAVPANPLIDELALRLAQADVAESLARKLSRQALQSVRGIATAEALRTALRDAIAAMIPVSATSDLAQRRGAVALVGPPGSGKTTTLAKLSAQLKLRHRRGVALLTLDTQRLGASVQLERYAELIGVPLFVGQTTAAVREIAASINRDDVLLIDTPGLALRDAERRERVDGLLRAAGPTTVQLVLPAGLSTGVSVTLSEFFRPLGVTELVLTRLDEAVGMGVLLNVLDRVALPVSSYCDGQTVPADLHAACPLKLAEVICPSL